MKLFRYLALAALLVFGPAAATHLALTGAGNSTGGGGGGCSQATAFIARANAVTTLNGTYTTAYTNLICGLVNTTATEGGTLYARYDILMLYASQSSGVALLNLPNSTYTATNSGCTFTANVGFAAPGSSAVITTTFNPSTATTPNYTQNSAHMAVWSLNAGQSSVPSVSIATTVNIFPAFTDGNTYLRVNDATQSGGFTSPASNGLFLANRDSSTTRQGYHNGVSVGTYPTTTSGAVPNGALTAINLDASPPITGNSVAAISAGASLSATDQLNFYNLLNAYMTAVGGP